MTLADSTGTAQCNVSVAEKFLAKEIQHWLWKGVQFLRNAMCVINICVLNVSRRRKECACVAKIFYVVSVV